MRFKLLSPKFAKRHSKPGRGRRRGVRLESLEDRRVLASFNPLPGVADGDPGSLRHAIIEANSNGEDDTITLVAGTYNLTNFGSLEGLSTDDRLDQLGNLNDTDVESSNDLDITGVGQTLTIAGPGADQTTITANSGRMFHVHNNATLTLEGVTLSGGNTRFDGGAFLNDGGTSTLRNVVLTDNTAQGEKLDNDEPINGGGGAVANYFSVSGSLLIEDSVISDNEATDQRGRGGGIYVRGGEVTLRRTTVENNVADGEPSISTPSGGGGIANEGVLIIEDSFILENEAGAGAGILNNGATELTISGTVIARNQIENSAGGGGGLYIVGAQFTATDSLIDQNFGEDFGGGVWIEGGGGTLINTTISRNSLNSINGNGGAIRNDGGQVTLINATISGNMAADTGGIFMEGGRIDITFSTIVNNRTTRSLYDGSSAFTNNGASRFLVDHTIIANNRDTDSVPATAWIGNVQSGGFNIFNNTGPATNPFSGGSAFQNINLAQTGDDLDLGDLEPNGGVPLTHALGENSIAIDHGRNSGGVNTNFPLPPDTDARGVNRPQGNRVDVGAYEFEVPNSPPTADAGGPYTASADASITLNGSGSSDPDAGDTLAYAWDIDFDGEYDVFTQNPTISLAGFGINTAGNHTIGLLVTDQGGLEDTDTATLTVTSGSIEGRHVFYNNSFFDGNNPAATAADDGAIATDKTALRPGQTSTTANFTSSIRGINGIMIDIEGSTSSGSITASDFTFRAGRTLSNMTTAPTPASVTVRAGAGVNGSDRVVITWADGAITNKWLEVTVKANIRTGIGSPDLFYFGNAIGDSMDQPSGSAVDANDFNGARSNTHNFLNRATKTDRYDFNRDSLVNGTDIAIVRDNATILATQLPMISPPANFQGGGEGEGEADGAAAKSSPLVIESSKAASRGLASHSATDAAYHTDVNGDLTASQQGLLLLQAASSGEAQVLPCSALDHEIESSLDLIADDLLAN